MRLNRMHTAHLQLMSEHPDLSLVVLFHFHLVLLELIDFVANQFHLLNLLRNLTFDLLRRAALVVELSSEGVQNLI